MIKNGLRKLEGVLKMNEVIIDSPSDVDYLKSLEERV